VRRTSPLRAAGWCRSPCRSPWPSRSLCRGFTVMISGSPRSDNRCHREGMPMRADLPLRCGVVSPRSGVVSRPRRTRQQRRRGVVTLELLFTLPVLLLVTFGTIEFSLVLAARSDLQLASREGARVASLGGSAADVEKAVKQFLGRG